MTNTDQESASWSAYWTQGENDITCLPGAPQIFGNLLDGIWDELGKSLAATDRVIDLACGSGAAGTGVLYGQQQLQIEGVDYADIPELERRNFPIIKADLSDLPFEDSRFQCAVSQFGLEYSNVKEVGPEVERVLSSGSPFHFIVHHSESKILHTNIERGNILFAVNSDDTNKAVKSLDLNALQSIFDKLFDEFGEHPLLLELANAVRAVLSKDKKATLELWDDLRNSMQQEQQIISALQRAAVAPDQLGAWQDNLGEQFQFDKAKLIELESDILCWNLSGTTRK